MFRHLFQIHERLAVSPRRPGLDNAGARHGPLGEDQHLREGDVLFLRRTKLEVSDLFIYWEDVAVLFLLRPRINWFLYRRLKPTFYNFRKVSKEFHLDYDKLEDRPSLPSQNGAATSGNAPGNSRYGFLNITESKL